MKTFRMLLALSFVTGAAIGVAVVRPAAADPGELRTLSDPRQDAGTGETLIVLVAGSYSSRAEASAANGRLDFDDVQGFVVARSDWFDSLEPGRWVLVTAFRTSAGADEFEPLAVAAGAHIRRVVGRYTGTEWIGLGQEASPDGLGPLVGPLG